MKTEFGRRAVVNIGWTATSKLIALVFQAMANVVLSRTLSSADYGVVGFAWVFINFLSQFNDVGINSAAVQRERLNRSVLSTAFTLKVVIAVSLFLIALGAAPLSAKLFDNDAVVGVIRLLSFNFLINALSFVPTTVLLRALDYRKISVANACSAAINAILSIVLVLSGWGYWSIVVGNLAASAAAAVILIAFQRHRTPLIMTVKDAQELIRYGRGLFASGLIVFAIFNADTFLIGSVAGSITLGYYTLAFQWGSMICGVVGAIVHSVLFPTLSRMQRDKEGLRAAYLVVLRYVSLIGILANVTLLLTADAFLYYILGHGSDKWLPALGALKILAVYGMIRVVLEPLGPVLMAVGRTQLLFIGTITAAAIEIIALYPSIKMFGIEGAAVTVTCAYAAQYFVYYPYIKREFGISLGAILHSVAPALVSGAVLVAAGYLYDYFVEQVAGNVSYLICKMAMCLVVYLGTYTLLTRGNVVREVRAMFLGTTTRVS
jgi:lipopolysaccharide exporter